MNVSLLALTTVALSLAACNAERPTDRVETRCLYGDLIYETRDGGFGFVENSPECTESDEPGALNPATGGPAAGEVAMSPPFQSAQAFPEPRPDPGQNAGFTVDGNDEINFASPDGSVRCDLRSNGVTCSSRDTSASITCYADGECLEFDLEPSARRSSYRPAPLGQVVNHHSNGVSCTVERPDRISCRGEGFAFAYHRGSPEAL